MTACGFYGDGSPVGAREHAETYLGSAFSFIGVTDIDIIAADRLRASVEKREEATAQAEQHRTGHCGDDRLTSVGGYCANNTLYRPENDRFSGTVLGTTAKRSSRVGSCPMAVPATCLSFWSSVRDVPVAPGSLVVSHSTPTGTWPMTQRGQAPESPAESARPGLEVGDELI